MKFDFQLNSLIEQESSLKLAPQAGLEPATR